MNKVCFPEITRFDELFSEYRAPFEIGKRHWDPLPLRPASWSGEVQGTIGEFCQGECGRSLHVRPTQKVVDRIRQDAVVPDVGPIFFRLIPRRDGTCLVTWSYNSILGGRWLALIDSKTLPKRVIE